MKNKDIANILYNMGLPMGFDCDIESKTAFIKDAKAEIKEIERELDLISNNEEFESLKNVLEWIACGNENMKNWFLEYLKKE